MTKISRRKFLSISAVCIGSQLLAKNIENKKITWEGIALRSSLINDFISP